VEISTEVWFNGKECVNVNHTMEEKALMDGGIGPKTGSMGSVVWNGKKTSKLYIEGIGKLEDTLRRVNYRGPIDLNTIVTKDKLYGLEFTCRFGYDAIFTFNELLKDSFSDILYGCATGVIKQMNIREGFAAGVSFVILPFPTPLEDHKGVAKELCRDRIILGVSNSNIKHIWFGDIYKKGKEYACSGVNGMLGVVTARWDTPGENPLREAKRRCYRTLSNLIIPDVMYRRDIGERVAKDKLQLEQWGWL
jgi:phosphoribosylamine--glycine ligase